MNTESLDKRIVGHMGPQGWNYQSDVGGSSSKVKGQKNSPAFTDPDTMRNVKNMDPLMAKPSSDNPGVDSSFWAKAKPQKDTTGHGLLTRPTCD